MDARKLDTILLRTVKSSHDDEKMDVFIRFKHPPRENEPILEKFKTINIRGANGKHKVLTASLSISEIDTVSEWNEVVAITQSTTLHPCD